MKKIIATVLAMVMALALCSTAFAANAVYTKAYDAKGDAHTGTYEVTQDVAAKYDRETDKGNVAYKVIPALGSGKFVVSDRTNYDYKLTASGRADLYVVEVTSADYIATAKVVTAVGTGCGQLNQPTTGTYYTDADGNYYAKTASSATNLLVDGKLVPVAPVAANNVVPHKWVAATYAKDNTVATYKCKYCNTVATVYDNYESAVAAGMSEWDATLMIGYNYTPAGTTATTTTTSSPKTFDAGIAMYVGMALTSVAGSAVVIGKKKEF